VNSFGWLYEVNAQASWWITIFLLVGLGFRGASLLVWSVVWAVCFWSVGANPFLWILFGAPILILNLTPIRRILLSNPILNLMDKLKLMPTISETERVALEAGATWVDAELFSGRPNIQKMLDEPESRLSDEEQAFLSGPVEEVCRMVIDWEVYQNKDLPDEVWAYLKKKKFFGMIVPKEFGGLGFSGIAQSEVIAKLAGRSTTLCVTVMVPNSLGPAELLAHYGTEQQKSHYLPRLADGKEIPCFALTEPHAGSDAGGISSNGVVFKGDDGKLYIRLNWEKRYITLAAISSLIGLAVKLKDPDNFLGKGTDPGITCVLVPAETKGVVLGKRHNPMGVPFYNCPTNGKDVIVSVDQIIGGAEGAGRGWTMLMESLAAGRSISLPSQAAGGSKFITAVTSAYAVVRRQFGVSIGKFEGIEEPLVRIVGHSYLMEAARVYTVSAVDSGIKPAVVSAIAKCYQTEFSRKIVNDGMDILGGAGVSRGPRNTLANAYMGMPISITVEGANILTRTMIIFGQGAIRCHPYAYQEVKALMDKDFVKFDKAFWGHVGHVVRNSIRSVLLSLSRGRLAKTPGGPAKKYYRMLAWSSASYAIMADIAMGTLGGALKLKEKLTGRYADALAWMYLATAVMKRYEAEGRRADHRDLFEWSMKTCFANIQIAFEGIFANFDVPVIGAVFRGPIYFWARLNRFSDFPADRLTHRIAKAVQVPGDFRNSLIENVYMPESLEEPLKRLENAFELCHQADRIYGTIRKAVRSKQLPKKRPSDLIDEALAAGVITAEEADITKKANAARNDAIQVDSFDLAEFKPSLLDIESIPVRKGRAVNG
jgi:acyl-CoA dehydrogenase